MSTLLERIASSENLYAAYKNCLRGKRKSSGYYKSLFAIGESLLVMQRQLLGGTYAWKGYRSFYVHDPKRRIVMAAPFSDRIVHHAIHRHIEPLLDCYLSDSVFACRHDRGNRAAVLALLDCLKTIGPNRFTMKLDVEKCYETINLKVLYEAVIAKLPDTSINPLLWALIHNHPEYAARGHGIPIGNLTSQLFANFYLSPLDGVAHSLLKQGKLFRYMDDLVLVGPDKKEIMEAAWAVVECAKKELKLNIPFTKMVPLGNDPVPFLGFVVSHSGYRILARNRRRHTKQLGRLAKRTAKPSEVAQVTQSFSAWKILPGETEVPNLR